MVPPAFLARLEAWSYIPSVAGVALMKVALLYYFSRRCCFLPRLWGENPPALSVRGHGGNTWKWDQNKDAFNCLEPAENCLCLNPKPGQSVKANENSLFDPQETEQLAEVYTRLHHHTHCSLRVSITSALWKYLAKIMKYPFNTLFIKNKLEIDYKQHAYVCSLMAFMHEHSFHVYKGDFFLSTHLQSC